MATHSSILTWRIPWTEEPGRLRVHGVAKSQTRLKQLNTHCYRVLLVYKYTFMRKFDKENFLQLVQCGILSWSVKPKEKQVLKYIGKPAVE